MAILGGLGGILGALGVVLGRLLARLGRSWGWLTVLLGDGTFWCGSGVDLKTVLASQKGAKTALCSFCFLFSAVVDGHFTSNY